MESSMTRSAILKVIYIAGRFRGANAWEVERNIRKAEELAFAVAELGAMPLCPHTNTRFFDGTLTPEHWLDGTLELMRRCDAVVFTDDWQLSSGARTEHADARDRGQPVFHSIAELGEWLSYRHELEATGQ
jgi:hypothetical protein